MSKKLTIEEMQRIAMERGGKCLSDTYINSSTKLLWQCAEDHQWKATPNRIKSGSWCPKCAGKAKGTIEEMQKIAGERGGKCLSDTYINQNTKLLWECAEGHQWKATPDNIKNRGSWCRICAHKKRVETSKLGIKEIQAIAMERGGKCLSNTYVNSHTKLLWECVEGHQWEAESSSIKSGSWCPYCAGKVKGTIKEMQKIAEERGGKCLSSTYVNNKTKLLWKCAEGHQWKATPNSIKRGGWCPECSSGLGERICKAFFEQLFGKNFPKSYPKWLVKQNGNRMELDGYCKSLRLAFEHHGEQHYSTNNPFIKTEEELRERQETDKIKRELCAQRGIVLIEIPEIPSRLPIEKVKTFIKNASVRYRISLPTSFDTKKVDLKNAYVTPSSKEALKELQIIAKERGGRCLSDTYEDNNTKLLWECAENHQWEATPHSIKSGKWCPNCAGVTRGTLAEMQSIAGEHGGKCLSKTYINNKTKLLWQCAEGHKWKAIPTSIKRGHWCPYCAGSVKGTLAEMQRLARECGGKCLSDTYVNNHTKLLWQCTKGHQWKATPDSIKGGSWCPYCAGSMKGTLAEMQRLARERGGKCLSNTYINNKTKLLWQCAEGHQWEAKPNNIKNGQWCPYCAGVAKGTLAEMQRLAAGRGGKCLSDTYVNSNTKLLWQCTKGHQWEAVPISIKNQGSWCPYCAGKMKRTIAEMRQIAKERGGKCLSDTYVNNRTKLLWECAEGHRWEARPGDIKNKGSWCPTCAKLKRGKKHRQSQLY